MKLQTVSVIFFAVLCCAQALYQTIPEGKELVYHFHGNIRAGTQLPQSYASAFVLDGKLHVQTDKNSTFMQFSDMKYKMFNGEYDDWHEFETKEHELPEEFSPFYKTFKVVHDVDGSGLAFACEDKEPEFIVNIKKAIANIMHMDYETVISKKHPHGFTNDEFTLYGKGKVNYNVLHSDEHLSVDCDEEPHSTQHMYSHSFQNFDVAKCHHRDDETLTRNSNKAYTFSKKDGYLEKVEVYSGVFFHPMQGESEGYYIWVNQTLSLLTVDDIKTKFEITTPKSYHGFSYHMADLTDMSQTFLDITHGRSHWDMEQLKAKIEHLMDELIASKEIDVLTEEVPDLAKAQLLNRMIRLMTFMNEETFNKLHADFLKDEKHTRIFYAMLPFVGTSASMHMIKHLVKDKKVEDQIAEQMLKTMSMKVFTPHHKLLEEMEELIHLGDDYSFTVRKAAIYSFATLIHKAVQRHMLYDYDNVWNGHHHKMEDYIPDLHIDEVYPNEKYYLKYIEEFGKKLQESKDTQHRLLYIYALSNTKMHAALKYLRPIIEKEMFEDDETARFTALLAAAPTIKDEDESHNVYWPVMTNDELPMNMRIYAMKMLLNQIPSRYRMINLFWWVNTQDNDIMYKYFYSYMKYMAHSMSPCFDEIEITMKQLLRYANKAQKIGVTDYYHIDYIDEKYGFGSSLSMSLVHAPGESETTMSFTSHYYMNGLTVTPYVVVFNVRGCDAPIFDNIQLDVKDPTKLFTIENVYHAFETLKDNKDIEIHITVMKYHQVVMSYYYDHSNIQNYMNIFKIFQAEHHSGFYKTMDMCTQFVMIPTEMGFPALYTTMVPIVHFTDLEFKKENKNSFELSMKYHKSIRGRQGLSFYNPVADVMQGISKYYTYDLKFNVLFDVSCNTQQHSMKLSWKRFDKPEDNVMGARAHVSTLVFIKNDFDNSEFKKSYPEMITFIPVQVADRFKHKTVFHDYHNPNTGYHLRSTAFDNEAYVSNATMNFFLQKFRWHSHENARTKMGHTLLSLMHRWAYMFIQPVPGTRGFLLKIEPSTMYPVSHIDISLRYNSEYKHGEYMMLPEMKKNFRITYSIKNKEKIIKTWDANLHFDANDRHTEANTKLQLSRIIPGQKDFRVCVDMHKKWHDENVELKATAAFSQSGENKCTDEEIVFEMKAVGEKSEDQEEHKHRYVDCMQDVWSDIEHQKSVECYKAHASLATFKYEMKTHNMPTEFKKTLNHWLNVIKAVYSPYYNGNDDHGFKLEENEYRMMVEYPMNAHVVDLHFHSHDRNSIYTGIPLKMWPFTFVHKKANTQYSGLYSFMHAMGLTEHCFASHDSLTNVTYDTMKYTMPNEWTLLAGLDKDAHHGLFVKKMENSNQIAIKMMHGEHSIEIVPHGHELETIVDGKKVEAVQHHQDWFYVFNCPKHHVVNMVCHHTGNHIIFDGEYVQIEMPQMNVEHYGQCFHHE